MNVTAKVSIGCLTAALLFPLFIIILIATALSMSTDWIKEHLLLEGTPAEELYIIQQIRPDLIETDQTVADGKEC